jgi:nitrite transporter NirC
MIQDFVKSIFAGFMIGIAGLIYTNVDNSWVGAILFSIGLIIICMFGYNLYTGKIGYIKSYKDIPKMLLYILGNFIGVYIMSLGAKTSTAEMVNAKLQIPLYLVLLRSMGCGFLMYIAVDGYKRTKNIISIVCCIPAFILAGFEHSIADLFYVCCSGILNWQVVGFIVLVIFGNALGALWHKFVKYEC